MFVSKSKPKRGFLIPLDIIREASEQGVSLRQLQDMVLRSTRITHPQGNRRFNQYLFMVEGNHVVAFGKLQDVALVADPEEASQPQPTLSVDDELGDFRCVNCKDSGRIRTFDQCGHCEGEGCTKCDEGLIPSSIPCTCPAAKSKVDKHA